MRRGGKERSPASRAVVDLREELGLSQARFAAEVMNLSWASIAKYETTHPPKGEQLVRLMEATLSQAKRSSEPRASALRAIADRFKSLYRSEVDAKANPSSGDVQELAVRVSTAIQEISQRALSLRKVTQADVDGIAKALREWLPAVKELAARAQDLKRERDRNIEALDRLYAEMQEKQWPSTSAVKHGGTSSSSAASRSAKAPTRKGARKR
jgi:transcriptional regulator with XRE-family HTH domain